MLRGLTTVNFFADDVTAAGRWYSELLGFEHYFVRPIEGPPSYVVLCIGDYQHYFGFDDSRYSAIGVT